MEKYKGFDLGEFEEPDRAKAIINNLDLNGEDDTITEYENEYIINERKVKTGTTPEEYKKIIEEFKKLLNPEDIKEITAVLNLKYVSEKTRERLYNKIKKKLEKVRITKGIKYIKEKCIYVENVLFYLVSETDRNKDFIKSYIEAWFNKKVKDRREIISVSDGEYLVLTDDEAEQRAYDYLTDDTYLWECAVKDKRTESSLQEWAEEVINIDGRGSLLSSYDGSEEEETINEVNYYIYRTN